MPIKLKSSGGGSVTLDAPSTGTDYTLTVPATTANVITSSGGTITGNVIMSGNVAIGTSGPAAFPLDVAFTSSGSGNAPENNPTVRISGSYSNSRAIYFQPGLGGNEIYGPAIGFGGYFDTSIGSATFNLLANRNMTGGAGISCYDGGVLTFHAATGPDSTSANTQIINTTRKMTINRYGVYAGIGNPGGAASRNNTSLQVADGIGFPSTQVSSTDVNTLDDYEEGTFSPGFTSSGSMPTVTYQYRRGDYVKIGKFVDFHLLVQGTWTGNFTGYFVINNLPFAASMSGTTYPIVSMGYHSGITYPSGRTWLSAEITPGGSYMTLQAYGSAYNPAALDYTQVASGAYFELSGSYHTAT